MISRLKRPSASGNVLFLLCLMYLITYMDRLNIATAMVPIRKELGLSATDAGLIFSAFAYPYALFQIFGGWMGDRFGPRRTLFFCSLAWAGSTVLTGLAGGFASLFMARVLLGFGEGGAFPVASRAIRDWTPKDQRGWAQGITHSCARLGNAITPPIIAFLVLWLGGWRSSFYVMGGVSLAWGAAWLLYFRDDPRTHKGITAAELDVLLPPISAGAAGRAPVPFGRLALRMLPVSLVYFCYAWTLWVYFNWLPSFFLNQYGMDLKNSALFSMGVFLAGVVGDAVGGIITDRIYRRTGSLRTARRNMVVAGLTGTLLFLLPVLLVHNLAVVAISLSIACFLAELTIGPMWAIPVDIAPQHAGTASGLMNTGSAVAGILSPIIFGLIIDKTGSWTLPFAASIGLLVFGVFMAFFMRPEEPFMDEHFVPDVPGAVPAK